MPITPCLCRVGFIKLNLNLGTLWFLSSSSFCDTQKDSLKTTTRLQTVVPLKTSSTNWGHTAQGTGENLLFNIIFRTIYLVVKFTKLFCKLAF